jgi:hypothetical protein
VRAGAGIGVTAVVFGVFAWTVLPAGGQVGLPPAVATQPADQVHATSAVLHASVNPNGLPTTYRFEYGRTTAYGSTTPRASAGSGTAPMEAEARIEGLRPGVTYHFRIVATNAAGTSAGLDSAFTTLEPRLRGRFAMRLRIKGAGGVYGHRKGKVVHRTYRFDPSCSGSRCPSVRLVRRGQRGHFRSTLNRVGIGVYRGVERFSGGLCDDGLRFHSRAPIKIVVKRLRGDRASRIKGKMKVAVEGCVHGRERSPFKGRLKG